MRIWNGDPYVLQVARVVHKVPPRRAFVTFIVKATFRLIHDHPPQPLSEPDPERPEVIRLLVGPEVPALRPDLPGADVPAEPPAGLMALPTGFNLVENDFAPFKPRADVVVVADAHAPGGEPVKALETAIRIDTRIKRLHVSGDHEWVDGQLTPLRPFATMPMTYAQAFGGPGHPQNPVGKGRLVQTDARGRRIAAMPNIVLPGQAVAGPDLALAPAGFGPLGAAWQPRASKTGTYDAAWRAERWPWYPADFDWGHWNCAPEDQQIEGYLKGDEPIAFKNLHPAHPLFRSRLPGIRARLFFKQYVPHDDPPEPAPERPAPPIAAPPPPPKPEPAPRPATGPDGLPEPPALDAVTKALMAAVDIEPLLAPMPQTTPRTDVFADAGPFRWREVPLNLDTMVADLKAERLTLVWRGLIEVPSLRMKEVGDLYVTHEPVAEPPRHRREHLQDLERMKAAVRAALNEGVGDPDATADEIERRVAAMEATIAHAQAVAREQAAALATAAPPPAAASQPPRPARSEPAPAPAMKPGLEAGLRAILATVPPAQARAAAEGAERARTGASPFEHSAVAAVQARGDRMKAELEAVRAQVLAEVEARLGPMIGGKVAGDDFDDRDAFLQALRDRRDMRGCTAYALDLRNLDLSGLDFSNASFPKCRLAGSILRETRLVHANFLGADLRRVDFSGADLGSADFTRARFQANRFHSAGIEMADFSKADLRGMDFSHARGRMPVFTEAKLAGCRFTSAHMPDAVMAGADLTGAVFAGANLTAALLAKATCCEAVFTGAVLERVNAGDGARFVDASFLHAVADAINLEKADLCGADFGGARLRGALLNEAVARGAVFEHADLADASLEDAVLARAVMVNANLLRASLARADLTATDLRGANLYQALFADTLLERTAVGGAFLKRSTLEATT